MRSCGQTSAVAPPISLLSLPGMFHQEIIKLIFLGFIMRKKNASVVGRVREWSLNHKL